MAQTSASVRALELTRKPVVPQDEKDRKKERSRHGLWRDHAGFVLPDEYYWMTLTLPATADGSGIAAPLLSW